MHMFLVRFRVNMLIVIFRVKHLVNRIMVWLGNGIARACCICIAL